MENHISVVDSCENIICERSSMRVIVIENVDINPFTNSSIINLNATGLVFQGKFSNRLQYSKAKTSLDHVSAVFL